MVTKFCACHASAVCAVFVRQSQAAMRTTTGATSELSMRTTMGATSELL
jgi:hypothetical protein